MGFCPSPLETKSLKPSERAMKKTEIMTRAVVFAYHNVGVHEDL
jgi:hypothetical protein